MNRRALVASVGLMWGTSGCLRLEAASTDPQSSSGNSDSTTPSSGEVGLETRQTIDFDIGEIWHKGFHDFVAGSDGVAVINADELWWSDDPDGIDGSRAFAEQNGTTVFGFEPVDETDEDAAAVFRGYNTADGSNRWEFKAPTDGLHHHPRGAVIKDGIAALGSNRYGGFEEYDPLVTGIDTTTGDVEWETSLNQIEARYLSGIWKIEDMICVGTHNYGSVLLDPESGSIEDTYESIQTATVGGHISGGDIYATSNENMYSFDLPSGERNWSASVEGRAFVPPEVDNVMAVVGTDSGTVYAFERSTGNQMWTGSVDDTVTSIALSTDYVWVAERDSGLTGFRREDGGVIHRSVTDVHGMVASGGTLIFGGNEIHIADIDG